MVDVSIDRINAIFKRTGLLKRAEEDARQNIPDASAPQWDGVKSAIVPAVKQEGEQELQVIREGVKSVREVLKNLQEGLETLRQYKPDSNLRERESALQRAEKKVNEAVANYNAFRKDNNLIRDASGDDRLAQSLWAFSIVVIEGVINSYFFKDAFEHGLVGGFLAAFFISAINVGFAFLGGVLGLRYAVNHCDANKKMFGVLLFAMCFAVCVFTVSLSAWFRGHVDDLLNTEGVPILQVANLAWGKTLESMQTLDMVGLLSSLSSFLLLFIGLLCTFFALHKGYQYDDPYPGFGDMYRAKENAEHECDRVRRECDERKDAYEKERHKQYRHLEQLHYKVMSAAQGVELGIEKNAEIERHLTDMAHNLLSNYLRANRQIRPTPVPEPPERFFAGEFEEIGNQYTRLVADFRQLSERELLSIKEDFASTPRA